VGTPCQDDFACEAFSLPANGEGGNNAWGMVAEAIVAAIADGAGSASNSARGAEIAVRTTVSEVRRGVEAGRTDYEALIREAALCARDAVVAEAAEAGTDARSYASTLLAVVFTPEGGAALQIGDGVIVVNDADGAWRWVFWPQHGEYVNTTYFLTSEDAFDRLQIRALGGTVSDVALTTDGLEPLVLQYSTKTAHAPFFDAMFRPLVRVDTPTAVDRLAAALETFVASDQVASRTDDDVSLILATRRGSETGT
jgi:hypothetical protein